MTVVLNKMGQARFERLIQPFMQDLTSLYRGLQKEIINIINKSQNKPIENVFFEINKLLTIDEPKEVKKGLFDIFLETGKSFFTAITKTIKDWTNIITGEMVNESKDNFERKVKSKRINFPKVEDLIPLENIQVIKSKERGKLITQSLKKSLNEDLKTALFESEKSPIRQRGVLASTMNPEVTKYFKGLITDTFKNYTKRTGKGMPSNIETIAVTETRRIINKSKDDYISSLAFKNPDTVRVMKVWRHNPHLSKNPRDNHSVMNGQEINNSDFFQVPNPKDNGFTAMRYPHDNNAPANQVIGCHCECEYFTMIKEDTEPMDARSVEVLKSVAKSLQSYKDLSDEDKQLQIGIEEEKEHLEDWKKVFPNITDEQIKELLRLTALTHIRKNKNYYTEMKKYNL